MSSCSWGCSYKVGLLVAGAAAPVTCYGREPYAIQLDLMLAGNKETIRRVVLTILIITIIISIVKHDNLFSPFSWYHHRHCSHRPHYYQLSTSTLLSPLFSTSSMLSHKSHHHQTGGSCNSSRCNSPRTAVESRPRFAHYSMRQPPCLPRSPPRGKLRKKHSHSKSKGPIPIPPVQILTLRTCLPRHRTLHESTAFASSLIPPPRPHAQRDSRS